MWFAGDVDQQLAQKESSTAIAMKNLEMANMSMVKVIGDVLRTREQFNREGDTDLGDFMDAIVNHCPDKMIGKRNAQGRAVLGAGNKITKASLAALHMRIIKGRANFKAVQGRVERLSRQFERCGIFRIHGRGKTASEKLLGPLADRRALTLSGSGAHNIRIKFAK